MRSLIQVMDTSITCLKDLESTPLSLKGDGDIDMYIIGVGGGSATPGGGPPGVPGGSKSGVGGCWVVV